MTHSQEDTVTILQKAQELIRNPANWTQKYYAATANDTPCSFLDESASKFSAIGATLRMLNVYGGAGSTSVFLSKVARQMGHKFLVYGADCINDNGTHADVMAMYDKAIALAKAEGN